jgi:hypothetical protein
MISINCKTVSASDNAAKTAAGKLDLRKILDVGSRTARDDGRANADLETFVADSAMNRRSLGITRCSGQIGSAILVCPLVMDIKQEWT